MISHVRASAVWGTERSGLPASDTLMLDDEAAGRLVLVEVTLAGVEPTKVLHLVRRRRRRGVEVLVPLAEGFVAISPADPRLRVLGAVVGFTRRDA